MDAAVGALAAAPRPAGLIVGKSTVPVGTARALLARIQAAAPAGAAVDLAWNPEFLREGFAVQDTLRPGPVGLRRCTPSRRRTALREVYAKPLAAGSRC